LKKLLSELVPQRDCIQFPYKGTRRTELVTAVRVEGETGQVETKFLGWHEARASNSAYEVRPR